MTLLAEVADIQTGPFGSQLHKKDYVASGRPIVTVEHLGKRAFTRQNLPFVSEFDAERLKKYQMKHGDVIFSRVGSVDRCSYAEKRNEGWLFSGRCLRIRPKKSIDPEFLYYYLSSKAIKDFVRNIAVGATMPSINTTLMGEIPIPAISLDRQRAIACIMSSLDIKLQANAKLNGYLEELADSLFKRRFGELPDNAFLSDVADITMGQSPAGSSYNENGVGTVFYQGRAEFGWRYPSQRLSTTEPKRMARRGDVLMSVRAPVGDLNIAFEDCCIGRGLAAIHSEHPSFCLYLMRSLHSKLDAFNGEGTVFGSINGGALKSLPIAQPKTREIQAFEKEASHIDALIRGKELQSRLLTTLRDTLLPRLMSGEIDVSKVALI